MRRPRGIAAGLAATLIAFLLYPASTFAQGSNGTPLPGQGSGNSLTPFTPQGPTPTQTATTPAVNPATSTTATGLSGTDGVAIGVGAVLVLGGISFFIWRDARRRAPVRQHAATAAAGGGPGPRQRPQKGRKLSPAERRRRKRGRAR